MNLEKLLHMDPTLPLKTLAVFFLILSKLILISRGYL